MGDIDDLKDRCTALENRMQRFFVWVTVIGAVAVAGGFTLLATMQKVNNARTEAATLARQVQADKDGLKQAQTDLVTLQSNLRTFQDLDQNANYSQQLLADVSEFPRSPVQFGNPWDSYVYDVTQLRSFAIRYAGLLKNDTKQDANYAILDGIQTDAGLAWARISLPSSDPSLAWHKQNIPEEFGTLLAKLRDERTQPGGPNDGAMACFEPSLIEWSHRAGITDTVVMGASGRFNLDYCKKLKVYPY